jgi:hypothetical protein
MGLDSIEILVKVEKTFGINIPNQEAAKIITVGDFHNSVWHHLEGRYSDKCKSQSLFYKLRQSFADIFKLPKSDFKLDASLNDIFPKNNRRKSYLHFAALNNLKLPDLELTKPWKIFLISFGFATIVGGLALSIILINFLAYSKWTLFIPVAAIILTGFTSEILNPKRVLIRPILIREFTHEVLALNYATLAKDNGTNRKEVESVINHIISDMVGLELNEVTPEKKIHHDLGID